MPVRSVCSQAGQEGAGISAISSVPFAFSEVWPALTLGFLHHIEGLGIGTIAAAFTMGKAIGFTSDLLDRHFRFATYKTLHN